jgi:hypothetical protein
MSEEAMDLRRRNALGYVGRCLAMLLCLAPVAPAGPTTSTATAPARTDPAPGTPDTWAGVERIVAVGDVHGDYGQFVKVLRAAGVIDAKGDWSAGKTHLVQTGDVLDRGPDSRKAMDLLMKLEPQAGKDGGAVHALIGNHEAMVLMDDLRYVHPGEPRSYGGMDAFRKAMSTEGTYGRWIRSHNTAIRINDLLFVHAAITPTFSRLSLGQINARIRQELAKGTPGGLAEHDSGPLWDREMAFLSDREGAEVLDPVLKAYGVRRMIVGHNVTLDGVQAAAGGRVIRIDVGMCEYYGGPAACLLVEKGAFYEIRPGRPRRPLDLSAAAPAGRAAERSDALPAGRARLSFSNAG